MFKKTFIFSLVLVLAFGLVLGAETYAFDEEDLESETPTDAENAVKQVQTDTGQSMRPGVNIISEFQIIDFGLPWIGGNLEIPLGIDIPGREIQPDYFTLTGLYKLGGFAGYEELTSFQGRGSIKYDLEGPLYTTFGVGYLNIGGFSTLTGAVKTGIDPKIGGMEINIGLVGQRSLWGAITDDYTDPYWFSVNLGIGF